MHRSFSFYFGLSLLIFFLVVAIFAPLLAPYNPSELIGEPYQRPNKNHWLGTNDIGQDILSELIYGTRTSLIIGISCSVIITGVGTLFGILSGFLSKSVDNIIGGLINLAMVVPDLPLTIVLLAYLGGNLATFILCMCITAWAGTARIVRARTLQIKELAYISIERTMGAGKAYIMFFHILPNTINMILVRAALSVGGAMMTEASLSFFGIGSFGQKSWGKILHYAFFRSGVMAGYWWWYLPPIVCISLCVMGFMLAGNNFEKKKTDEPREETNL